MAGGGGMGQPGLDDDPYGDESADGGGLADMFLNNPAFNQLRERLMENPAMLGEFLNQIQTERPEIAAAI